MKKINLLTVFNYMGHQVDYEGSLKFKNPLTEEQKNLVKEWQDNWKNCDYDYFYALKLDALESQLIFNRNCEKIYPNNFFTCIELFTKELKKLGNDFTEKSYLISCSEYGLDSEAIVFIYAGGKFVQKPLLELVSEYINNV